MELRHLRYFLAVAEALHFGRAARRLHVSQPTLSQQVKQLEEELGSPLFERKRSGIRLTQAGELFRAHATRALEDVYAGERAVQSLQGLETGRVRVGYLPSLRGLILPAISAVMRKYPGVEIYAEEGLVRRLEQRVAEGKLDVGLSYAPTRALEIEAEPVFASRLGVIVPAGHPLARIKTVKVRQLAGESFALLARGLRARAAVDAFFTSARFSPRVVLESNAVATVLAVVRAGHAVTVLPEPMFAGMERLPILELSPAPPSQGVALVWRKDAPRPPAALAFAEEVRTRARPSPGS